MPKNIISTVILLSRRVSKSVATTRMAESDEARKSLFNGSEDSDDSLVGEHSPFVKHTANKTE